MGYLRWYEVTLGILAGVLIVASFVISVGNYTSPHKGNNISKEIVDWSEQYVWKIDHRGDFQNGHGTGFFVNEKTMITACHVALNARDKMMYGRNHDYSNGGVFEILYCNQDTDTAIMRVLATEEDIGTFATMYWDYNVVLMIT